MNESDSHVNANVNYVADKRGIITLREPIDGETTDCNLFNGLIMMLAGHAENYECSAMCLIRNTYGARSFSIKETCITTHYLDPRDKGEVRSGREMKPKARRMKFTPFENYIVVEVGGEKSYRTIAHKMAHCLKGVDHIRLPTYAPYVDMRYTPHLTDIRILIQD